MADDKQGPQADQEKPDLPEGVVAMLHLYLKEDGNIEMGGYMESEQQFYYLLEAAKEIHHKRKVTMMLRERAKKAREQMQGDGERPDIIRPGMEDIRDIDRSKGE